MLSKKYYNQLAEIFKFGYLDSYKTTYLENGNFDNNKIGSHIAEMQWKLIEFLKSDNPNFNENKFDEIILDTVNKKLVKMKLNIQLENLTQYIK